MNFKSVWLIVLTMLMAIAHASAANVNFNGGAVASCTLSGSTYSCTGGLSMGATDVVVIASGYTVVMTSFAPSYNQGLTISGTGALQTSGNLDLSGINPANISTGGATLTAGGSFTLGSSTTINGSVVAASINTNSGDTITGSVTVSGLADLGSAIKINGNLNAGSVKTNSPGTISGSITANTTIAIGSGVTVGGNISGTTITTNSPVTLKGNVTASTSFTLASGSTVTGNISAPTVTLNASSSTVTGSISATGALDIGSGNTVNGAVGAGSLTMRASGATINGATTISGDVDMGSGTVINGDLSARNVTTHASGAVINGNAAVNAIYIDWGDSVTKTITCTGPGAVGCSCVTRADSNYHPICGAAPPAVPHHFQINHGGTGLTCQPQTVTVTACANAACTAPNFTSNVDVTLLPGGKTFTITGGVNSAASVQSKDAGTFALSASATGVSNASTCLNSGSGSGAACDMTFSGTGLTVTGSNHISMASGALVTIQALTSSSSAPSCIPLVSNQTVNIDMACSYQNPASGSAQVGIGAKSASCGANAYGGTVSVPFTFDANGLASAALQYADVGKVGLKATYTTSSLSATGSGDFIAAPDKFLIKAVSAAASIGTAVPAKAPADIFARAGEAFTLTVTAVNRSGNPTPNFGKESTASRVKFTPSINNPAEVPVPSGTGSSGNLWYDAIALTFNGGIGSTSASFDNVGYLKLTAALDDGGSAAMPYYLGVPLSAFQTSGTQFVSRFIPDHFDTALMTADEIKKVATNTHLSCASLGDSINPCKYTGAGDTFVHSRQAFFVKVLAYNRAGALTTNYFGTLAKVIGITAMSGKGGDTPVNAASDAITWSRGNNAVRFTFPTDTSTGFVPGIGLLTIPAPGDSANLPAFKFAQAYPDKDVLPATIYLRATDEDGVSSKRTVAADSVEAPLVVVSGRLMVANGYGSPRSALPVNVTAQYYLPAGYVFNPLASGSGIDKVSSYIKFSNCQKKVSTDSCPSALTDSNAVLTVTNGIGKFMLAAPVPVTGVVSTDIRLIDTSGVDLIPFLPSTSGRETFGLYRSGPVIYTREVF
ncbi:DUF6701 domain-containing protein [Duganella radicis]|uniref:DUF6701 domain-containing protein n=1 Tax=Duganella radicis TaxID=551988 RepID=A0A6L6PEU5_9BURK|nr:DUF6701 domain-containing protein [Duganella radicis]MTV37578.1 hypothetical protein [Duganella radicis]